MNDNGAPRIFFLIPVFNEMGNVDALVDAFQDLSRRLSGDYEPYFLVIDDGSRDGTADAFCRHNSSLPLTVLRHDRNKGPGVAFSTGFLHLANQVRNEDWVVTMEGDNTSRHELVLQMLTRSREGYDVVLASPYLYGGGILNTNFSRTFLSYGANIFMKEILEIRGILTMSSFFRLYSGTVFRRLQVHYGPSIVERPGFDCMVELLMKMIFLRVPISEVAMVLDTSRRKGKSKMNVMRTILDVLTLVFHKPRWKALAHPLPEVLS